MRRRRLARSLLAQRRDVHSSHARPHHARPVPPRVTVAIARHCNCHEGSPMPNFSKLLRSSILAATVSSCVPLASGTVPCESGVTFQPVATRQQTERVFDLAIEGEGFFTLRNPVNG